jgi:hypothetical protein
MKNEILLHKEKYSIENYIRMVDPEKDYLFSFFENKINKDYIKFYGDKFNLIICGNKNINSDFYIIPYTSVKHIFVKEHIRKLKDKNPRWIGNIKNNILKVNNCNITIDCSIYYGNGNILKKQKLSKDEINDYSIYNKMTEIKIRQKQSKFRKDVLNNFQNKCCISGITELDLLRASHIIPWADSISTRLDPQNGLCLSILYDALFDHGYFSIDDQYKIIIPKNINKFSIKIKNILMEIRGKEIIKPIKKPIKLDYIQYHRENIFKLKNGA